jgi:hypothetical protein
MKRTIVVVALLVATFLQGCIVKSVHPFFKESDIVYKKSLEGSWTDQDNNRWSIHANPFKQNSYELHYSQKGREVSLLGHLFSLNGQLYLDMMPLQDNSEEMLVFDMHLVPTHSIAKVAELDDHHVVIRWFNEEWLRKMFVENRIKISHEMIMDENPTSKDDGMYLLTASTDELQKFVVKYGRSEEAFDSDLYLQLRK